MSVDECGQAWPVCGGRGSPQRQAVSQGEGATVGSLSTCGKPRETDDRHGEMTTPVLKCEKNPDTGRDGYGKAKEDVWGPRAGGGDG